MTGQSNNEQIQSQWARVRGKLRAEMGETAYKNWLKKLTLLQIRGQDVEMAVPTRFVRDWIVSHYQDRLRALWQAENPALKGIEIIVDSSSLAGLGDGRPSGRTAETETAPAIELSRKDTNDAPAGNFFGAVLDPRFTFENFVVGKPNEFAYAAARRVAEARTVPFNPLFLYGGVGLGKTHLMHAIAWHIRKRNPERRVIYLSAEKFMYQFIRALRDKNTMAFKEQFRSVDVLMIDDVQFISGKDSTQEEFFHTFNALVDQNRQIVISADKSPSRSRGHGGAHALAPGLGPGGRHPSHRPTSCASASCRPRPSRCAIAGAAARCWSSSPTRSRTNVRELEGALNRIVAHRQLIGREITLEMAQEVLHDLLRANDRRSPSTRSRSAWPSTTTSSSPT